VLAHEVKICLSLKTLCGFSIAEIAKALLCNEKTIAQRIVRAKRKIKECNLPFEMPPNHSIADRLDSILDVIYLLFNEGYAACQGEELIREELCYEAIRLGTLLSNHPVGNIPKTHALLALLFFQASRLATRVDEKGSLLLLQEQDRSQWDQKLIQSGMYHLHLSQKGKDLTTYHLQAGIAACHATANNPVDTNWAAIVWYYEQLSGITPSPLFALNKAIAVAYLSGAEAGLQELLALENDHFLNTYYLYFATLAELSVLVQQYKVATDYYLEAIHLAQTKPEKEYLHKKLDALSAIC
jgi:RNA polymerase sigma-70 factor (ECF subfamily)